MKNDTSKTTKYSKSLTIGAHLSIAGGYINALDRIQAIGGNCLQIFSQSPRQWHSNVSIQPQIIQSFTAYTKKLNIHPVYFHASYLINLADNDRIGKQSVDNLIKELLLAEKLQIKGTIVHLGSFKTKEKPTEEQYERVIKNILTILDNTPKKTLFIIENAGNKKIGCNLSEIEYLVKRLNNSRIRVCLDTCHLHAAGYDLSTKDAFNNFFDEFDKKIGSEKLEVIQLNDSKAPIGSFRDLHENIGKGTIPSETFRLFLTDKRTKNLPFILEVPGFDKKGPDRKNIQIVKQLAS